MSKRVGLQIDSAQELHHHERGSVELRRRVRVGDEHHVLAANTRRGARLLLEALGRLRIEARAPAEDLHREPLTGVHVLDPVDGARAGPGDEVDDDVAARNDRPALDGLVRPAPSDVHVIDCISPLAPYGDERIEKVAVVSSHEYDVEPEPAEAPNGAQRRRRRARQKSASPTITDVDANSDEVPPSRTWSEHPEAPEDGGGDNGAALRSSSPFGPHAASGPCGRGTQTCALSSKPHAPPSRIAHRLGTHSPFDPHASPGALPAQSEKRASSQVSRSLHPSVDLNLPSSLQLLGMHAHAEAEHEVHWAISVEPEHSVIRGSSQKTCSPLSAKTVAAVNVRIPAATTATSDGYATPERERRQGHAKAS